MLAQCGIVGCISRRVIVFGAAIVPARVGVANSLSLKPGIQGQPVVWVEGFQARESVEATAGHLLRSIEQDMFR